MSENRFRCLADVSLKNQSDSEKAGFSINDKTVQDLIANDLHSNNYRDGVWGHFVPMLVKDGTTTTVLIIIAMFLQ